MAVELVPLKVRIGLRSNGHADHPNFNALPAAVRTPLDGQVMDWAYYVDLIGGGWHYDKCSGHRDSDAGDSGWDGHEHRNDEVGIQYGCLLVDAPFAEAAVAKFPTLCTIIDETSFECFYDDRAHAHEPEIHKDAEVIKAIKDIKAMEADPTVDTVAPDAAELLSRKNALDPNVQTERGLRKNLGRFYADYKIKKGVTIRAQEAKA